MRRLRAIVSTDETGQGGSTASTSARYPHGQGRDLVQLVTPSGERVSHPEFDYWVRDITDEQLCSLYEDMTVIRRIDVEATALQRQGELGLWPPLTVLVTTWSQARWIRSPR